MRVIMKSQSRTRLELVLDFDRPVSMLRAQEAARKLLDHMQISVEGYEAPEELGEITLRSGELKRSIRIPFERGSTEPK